MQDFATSSLQCEVVRQEAVELVPAALGKGEDLEQYQIVERRRWEHRYVTYDVVVEEVLRLPMAVHDHWTGLVD